MTWVDTVNTKVAQSIVGRYFQLDGSGAYRERKGTRFLTELRAGATTFFAMVRIIYEYKKEITTNINYLFPTSIEILIYHVLYIS